jgi:hypothetical protein
VRIEQLQRHALDHHVLHGQAQHGVDVGLVVDHQHLPAGGLVVRRGAGFGFGSEKRGEVVGFRWRTHSGTSM